MPPLGKVLLIPGFQATHLDRINAVLPNVRFWFSAEAVVTGAITNLELNAAGTGPANPLFAGNIQPAGLIAPYYDPLQARLLQEWEGFTLLYDWRLAMNTRVNAFYDAAIAAVGPGDFYMIGHSMGGLIARLIWRRAVQLGTQARIKRIVTLGTPHWGSYEAVRAFARLSETYQLLHRALQPAQFVRSGGTMFGDFATNTLDRLIVSWPGLYELFPNVHQPGLTSDPLRPELFNLANWLPIQARMSAAHLAGAQTFHSDLLAAIPPDGIMVPVIGKGRNTAVSLLGPLLLDSDAGYRRANGDGVVGTIEAELGQRRVEVFSDHAELPRHPEVLARMTRWLLEGLPASAPVELVPGMVGSLAPQQEEGPPVFDDPRATIPFFDPFSGPRFPSLLEPRRAYCP